MVSAIVVVYATPAKHTGLRKCLASIRAGLDRIGGDTELIVVLNRADYDVRRDLQAIEADSVVVDPGRNLGFAGGVAVGVRESRGKWIALLNDDVVVEPDALAEMLAAGEASPDIGSVAAQMRFSDRFDIVNSAGIEVDRLGVAYDRHLGRRVADADVERVEVFGACGGAALYRRAMFDQLGGFDESFWAYLEDVDLAWRAQMRGWRCVHTPRAVVAHDHSRTLGHASERKYFLVGRNRVRLIAKNADRRQLLGYGLGMVAYDVGYVAYVGFRHHTLAPLRGRLRGLCDWATYRRAGEPNRRSIQLPRSSGFRGALARERAWAERSYSERD